MSILAQTGTAVLAREIVISVRELLSQFGDHIVHERLDLDVYRGEVLGIVGASGGGKSVMLRTLTGLITPRAGRIEVFGQDLSKLSMKERLKIEQRWGVLFQDGALFSSLTVLQNIQVPMREHLDLSQSVMDELAHLKLSMVGLAPVAANKFPSELSGGMRKRAGLARALSLDPEVVFLDEPTSGLDPIGAADFDDLIKTLQETLGLTVFMVTHDLDSIYAICDRIAVLADRKVVVTGTIDDMVRFDHPWVQDYFRGTRARNVPA